MRDQLDTVAAFTLGERASGTYLTGILVGPRGGLQALDNRKIKIRYACWESNHYSLVVKSVVYWLRYFVAYFILLYCYFIFACNKREK
jgi:hypothetical protein